MTQEIFDLVVRDGRRRRARFLGGAAVVVTGLVTAGVVLLPGDTATDCLVAVDGSQPTASPTDCPATAERAPDHFMPAPVPAPPQGFDGATQLLPEGIPSSVVVCRYEELSPSDLDEGISPPAALVDGRSLAGDLSGFVTAVSTPPAPDPLEMCGDALGVAVPVRVEVTYPSGARAWLATEQNTLACTVIGNGLFVNDVDVGSQLLEAWQTGRWGPAPSPPPAETVVPVAEADCPTEAAALPPGPDAVFPVPALPEGFDPSARLVPDEVPVAVLVCRYDPIPYGTATDNGQASPLVGGRSLAGDLSGLARALDVPLGGEFGGCRLVASDPDPLRVLLRYPSGASVWLATETAVASCRGVGNGVARSATYLADAFLSAWEKGGLGVNASATMSPPIDLCAPPAGDRPGQDDVLVPDGWTSVSLCGQTGPLPVGDPAEVVRLLNAASSGPTGEVGRGETFDECVERYPAALLAIDVLRVDYPAGPSVVVRAAGACSPAWTNGSRGAQGAQPTREQQARLWNLLDR